MNGTSGFQEVRSSISQSSTNRFLREQQPKFGTGAWHLLHIHNPIALFTGISAKSETVPDTVSLSLFRSEAIAIEKSQNLSTVIVTMVLALLMVITVMAWLSLALVLIAARARRAPRQSLERQAPILHRPGRDDKDPSEVLAPRFGTPLAQVGPVSHGSSGSFR